MSESVDASDEMRSSPTNDGTDASQASIEQACLVRDLASLRQFFKVSGLEFTFLAKITASEISQLQEHCHLATEHRYRIWALNVFFGRSLGDRTPKLVEALEGHGVSLRVAFLLALYGRNVVITRKTLQFQRRAARDGIDNFKADILAACAAGETLLAFTGRLQGLESLESELRSFLGAMQGMQEIPEEVLLEQFGPGHGEMTRSGVPIGTRNAVVALTSLLESARTSGKRRWAQDVVDLFAAMDTVLSPHTVREWYRTAKK